MPMIKGQQTLTSKFEHGGRTYEARLGTYALDWDNPRRRAFPSNVSVDGVELVAQPLNNDEDAWLAWRKASVTLLQPLVNAALALFGVEAKAAWSARKLCSCGCSPAWVLDAKRCEAFGGPTRPTIHITVKEVK